MCFGDESCLMALKKEGNVVLKVEYLEQMTLLS